MKIDRYLSIGEVSRITNVNVKSLRYYDRIGALVPTYTDPNTGYRYYSPTQLGIVNAIQICVEMGIPLKHFSEYYSNNKINTFSLLEEAVEASARKIQAITKGLCLIQELQAIVTESDALIEAGIPVIYEVPKQKYTVEAIPSKLSSSNFIKVIGRLYNGAFEEGYQPGYKFGRMYFFRKNGTTERYAYTIISGTGTSQGTIEIPSGQYTAIHTKESKIEQSETIFPDLFSKAADKIVMESEILSSVYNSESPDYELRCSVLP